jgi:type IX secretion system PorP/SprF family membrane protein
MKKLFTKVALIVAGITSVSYAQQDPQFTNWMNNKMIYNPGYAGTTGGYCGTLQFRKQWAGFEGAPTSINFAGDMKLQNIPLGVGLTFINDKIGPMSTNYIRGAAAFVTAAGKGTFGVGLDVGILQKTINNTWVVPEPDKADPTIPGGYGNSGFSNQALNKTTYDLGFGAYYTIPSKFYVGLSSTHLPAQTVKGADKVQFEVSRHFYVMTGVQLDVTPRSAIIPNIKYKSDLASGALDLNVMYQYSIDNKKIWGGPTFRLYDAAALLLGYSQVVNGKTMVKGGFSYDFVLSKLKGNTSGSIELFLGLCYTPSIKKATTYETDRFY